MGGTRRISGLKELINAAAAVHVTAAVNAMASCVQLLLTSSLSL